MTLQQLEYVIALDKYRHFVKAAEHCFVSQPNLTMQVRKLEEEIGIVIFDRESKPLKPTKAGEQFIIKSREILNNVNHLKEFVSGEKEIIQGEFTIAIIPTLADSLLPLFLSEILSKNKDLFLNIVEMETNDIIKELKNGKIDLALLATPLGERTIREIPIFNEPFLLYFNKEDELAKRKKILAKNLKVDNLLLLDEGHCFREQTLALCELKNEANFRFNYKSGSIKALKNLVDKGIGYTLLPELSSEGGSGILKRFDGSEPVREVSIVCSNNFTKEKLIDELHKIISKNLPEKLNKIRKYFRVEWK